MSDKSGSSKAKDNSTKKLGVVALAGVVISAMLGGGVYNLPQNMAQHASAGAILIAWIITGFGMWFIANTFRVLAAARPDVTTGIYAYGELGFGKFTGFLMAWGYWICNSFANVGYAVLLMDSLNYFFPSYFTGGNNWLSIVCGSIVLWIIYFAVLSGVKQAAFLNVIGTIGKLVPLAIFILVLAISFKVSLFFTDFWGLKTVVSVHDSALGGLLPQVKSTMLVTLWVFTGIEGAVVVSGRAKSQKDVGKATFLGFLICLLLYTALSLLPLGVVPQGTVSKMAPPSTAAVLMTVMGKWGSIIMNIGVIIAILSSWLIWTVMLSELPYAAAKGGTFPKVFTKENKNEAPSFSLLASTIVMQIILICVHFTGNAWNMMLSITSVMALPCYIASTLYLYKISSKDDTYPKKIFASRTYAYVTAIIGTIYGLWLLYAAGLEYLLISLVIYAIGIPVFKKARRETEPNKPEFTKIERYVAIGLIVLGIVGLIYLFKFM
ncbi:basic amino acid/polyamine antiporter [Paraclostridium sordellii]|uniref:basic amino acid/polyamine antiporter n=1 Tax=Paraclostridium sordellii TaxID=1505 RepID=UPI0005DA98D2|nr:basic amino acid/polyamine antiporter [Paeniclostridium sordellii]CEN90232.1 amino acid permease [[Clostridium] sordellii] [Paeniclostridium sordellii]CEQ13507.1 amino acid permease [[Clostridium] sordellii] [Paeniclostridium sordellii]